MHQQDIRTKMMEEVWKSTLVILGSLNAAGKATFDGKEEQCLSYNLTVVAWKFSSRWTTHHEALLIEMNYKFSHHSLIDKLHSFQSCYYCLRFKYFSDDVM